MLLLDSRTREINGISVFPDHADPEQWYYMPTAPHLTTVRDPALGIDVPQFLLIGFRGDAGTGGFLNFDCNVGASAKQIDDLAREIANAENLRNKPRIAPVPLEDGSVRLLMLGKASGDTAATPGGGPQFVLKIDQAAKPALYGNNQAAFSVRLDQDGYTVMEQCLEGEILPVAVIYSLDFLGLRPAYNINLKIDWDRVQKHMDESFSGGNIFFSTEIGKAVDELVEKRAIVLESDTFVAESEDTKGIIDRRDAALAQVRNMVTDAFFQPSLPPWSPEKKNDFERGLEAIGKFAAESSARAAGGPIGALMPSFSYKRMDYKRVDRKKLNVNFSERVAIKRSIHPQGHLAALFKTVRDGNVPRERLVKQISLDNDFFKKRRVKVISRADLAGDDIGSINVRVRYGDKAQNALLGANAGEASFEWLSQLERGAMKREVQVEYEVNFKGVDAAERPTKLKSKPQVFDVENIEVVPRDLYAINTVPVLAENYPWDRYSSVDVFLRYRDPANKINQNDMVRLTKDAPAGSWKMFMIDLAKTGYQVRLVHHAISGPDKVVDWADLDEPQVTVRNPFPTRRVLQVVPNFNWSEVQEVFVDLRYADRANDVLIEQPMSFQEGTASQTFAVDMRNPDIKAVFYSVSILYKDGRDVEEIPESVTFGNRIMLKAGMKGRRIVTVKPPSDFAKRKMRKVRVSLRFEDLVGGLNFAEDFEFDNAQAVGEFEYDYLDPARMRYEYKASYLLENGTNKSLNWSPGEATDLVLKMP
ncbi:hypothetical protein K4L06_10050 [Lysobacter sp. BMK333-48F3]|uniref:hypothetical protein n=1 Tax=Lysobacter sp. BMK333-48F3 TaxID=2867962 RepID=UPI001C8BB580|nr:hypothetical protein [Lysobacter sp. BMK333-48F3]MBX9401656.1 hypothetical protein [Lysobacter sp. BMK333-48F3]